MKKKYIKLNSKNIILSSALIDRQKPFHLKENVSRKLFKNENALIAVLKRIKFRLSIFIQ